MKITKSDIDPIIEACKGDDYFITALAAARDEKELLTLLCRYVQFNSVFGAGVANLAGEISARQDLFRDKNEKLRFLADRSIEIGGDIFSAAVDEFADRSFAQRHSHRSLAQATIKGIGYYYRYDDEQMNDFITINAEVERAIERTRDGYKLNRIVAEQDLFNAIGFHMGSEVLADREFNYLDKFFQNNYPDLVEYLRSRKVMIGNVEQDAYHWIFIHTSAEADHFDFAVKAANSALYFYVGENPIALVKAWIIDGFRQFADLQEDFMRSFSR
jgi:hypothetical protein